MLRPQRDHKRRGSNAVEFALVSPFLMMMALGTLDYGWYFYNQWFVMSSIQQAARFGATQSPDVADAPGACAACLSTAASEAVSQLATHNITVVAADVTPVIVTLNGTCALSFDMTIPHTSLVGFVPVPDHYTIDAIWFLPNVTGC